MRKALLAAALAALVVPSAASASSSCREIRIPVTYGAGHSAEIAGTLCLPSGASPGTVQVLIPGGTYARPYWDFPFQPSRYSYVRFASAAGQATLAIDRLGTGRSTIPPSAQVDFAADVATVHQVVQALRRGAHGLPRARRVLTVGHSLGSLVAIEEAGTFHDVDGVLISGFQHSFGPDAPEGLAAFHPANQDPAFAAKGLDDGYQTTLPGRRGVFYAPGSADPAVIDRDESLKDLLSATEISSSIDAVAAPPEESRARDITAPVFVVMGDGDSLVCPGGRCTAAGTRDQVRPFYTGASRLDVAVVPDSGHNVNLHRSAPVFYALAVAWAARVGSG